MFGNCLVKTVAKQHGKLYHNCTFVFCLSADGFDVFGYFYFITSNENCLRNRRQTLKVIPILLSSFTEQTLILQIAVVP
ncbi:CLUMA_CG002330, isoform A [Clunio marinus]|uniref:CLUMA_CG002330, isoform A n=1 Tax=Clunio marinus TaxID=568069 RepID=A0A1J1HM61_9DIPT|nr:CLUMA_CG002330, isoform A [Clunio marinus]